MGHNTSVFGEGAQTTNAARAREMLMEAVARLANESSQNAAYQGEITPRFRRALKKDFGVFVRDHIRTDIKDRPRFNFWQLAAHLYKVRLHEITPRLHSHRKLLYVVDLYALDPDELDSFARTHYVRCGDKTIERLNQYLASDGLPRLGTKITDREA